MVKIGLKAGKRTHVNEDDIIRHVTKMRSAIHLSADQNLIVNHLDLNIIFASPSNGNLTKETVIFYFYSLNLNFIFQYLSSKYDIKQ